MSPIVPEDKQFTGQPWCLVKARNGQKEETIKDTAAWDIDCEPNTQVCATRHPTAPHLAGGPP